jgi:excisionase family DNA binding protein
MATSKLDRTPHVYLGLPEAAEYLGLSVKTLRRRISAGTLPAYRFGPRSIRVRLADLEASGHRVPSAAP